MRRNCFLLMLATCLLSVALGPSQSSAKDCGDGIAACECGDTVRGRATLTSNLGVCMETGLFVANGSLLDCNHHTITGRGQEAGVLFENASGAAVHNCRITNFQIGVRVKGGQGNAIVGNAIVDHEKYGIDLADAAAGVRIESNTVRDNGDEGIHVGTGARDTAIVGNQFVNSKKENVYLLAASGTRVIGNVVVHARDGAGIFIKHSTNTYVADNIVFDNPIQVRGGSRDNVLEDNALRGFGSGYVFEAMLENGAVTHPQRNQVTEGTVFHAERCVHLRGAYDTRIQGVTAGDCSLAAVQEESAQGLGPPFRNVIDLAMTEPTGVAGRAAVQVSTTSRTLRAGDVLSLGLAVHHNNSVELDLYVGLFLPPDNQIAFFSGPGLGGLRLPPVDPTRMQQVFKASSLTLPRFLEVALPPGVPPGTYQFFAALVTPNALSDGVVTASELAAFDLEQFTIAP